jgi:hypothetical protein
MRGNYPGACSLAQASYGQLQPFGGVASALVEANQLLGAIAAIDDRYDQRPEDLRHAHDAIGRERFPAQQHKLCARRVHIADFQPQHLTDPQPHRQAHQSGCAAPPMLYIASVEFGERALNKPGGLERRKLRLAPMSAADALHLP